ncbi:MAG: hypothetical protein ACK4FA_00410 [Candidatus Paceibacteria bacterium]
MLKNLFIAAMWLFGLPAIFSQNENTTPDLREIFIDQTLTEKMLEAAGFYNDYKFYRVSCYGPSGLYKGLWKSDSTEVAADVSWLSVSTSDKCWVEDTLIIPRPEYLPKNKGENNILARTVLCQAIELHQLADTLKHEDLQIYRVENDEYAGRTVKFSSHPGLLLQTTVEKNRAEESHYLLFANDTVGQVKVWWSNDEAIVYPDWAFKDVRFNFNKKIGVWFEQNNTDNFTEYDTLRLNAAYEEIGQVLQELIPMSTKVETLEIPKLPVFNLETNPLSDFRNSASYDTMTFFLDAYELSLLVKEAKLMHQYNGWSVYQTEKQFIADFFGRWKYAARKISKRSDQIDYHFYNDKGKWVKGFRVSFTDVHVWNLPKRKAPSYKKLFKKQ